MPKKITSSALVHQEAAKALSTHAVFPGHEPTRALRILIEEVGEVARAINPKHPESDEALMVELAQVGAVCAMWLDYLVQNAGKRRSKYER